MMKLYSVILVLLFDQLIRLMKLLRNSCFLINQVVVLVCLIKPYQLVEYYIVNVALLD